MFEILTRRAKPTAASHAANTRMMMGIGRKIIELELRIDREVMMKRDNIMPSKHRRVDIRWERNMRVPNKARVNAMIRLSRIGVILVVMKLS